MKKKLIIGNLILIAFITGLGLSFVDFPSEPNSFEETIESFIYARLAENGEDLHYTPLTFEEINEPFLMAREEITKPMQVVADSMHNQLKMIENAGSGLAFQKLLTTATSTMEDFGLTQVSDLLKISAGLKREVQRADNLNKEERAALHTEETRMMNAINELNTALSSYNLSVFNLDFEQTETTRFYHTFLLSESNSVNISNHQAVFEISNEDKSILAFKEI